MGFRVGESLKEKNIQLFYQALLFQLPEKGEDCSDAWDKLAHLDGEDKKVSIGLDLILMLQKQHFHRVSPMAGVFLPPASSPFYLFTGGQLLKQSV